MQTKRVARVTLSSLRNAINNIRSNSNNNSHLFRKQIFSGIQPTSIPHIGNYFGAIKQWVDLQSSITTKRGDKKDDEKPMIISIVDLHAITLPMDPRILKYFFFLAS